ncbi:MAG: hypothetical protein RLN88_13385 [Ekhidna sp.]|uniref:hypothetical protein n=1 Tax=Ekhidna sp. TaxID=2608089 RepID=UPI0032F03425
MRRLLSIITILIGSIAFGQVQKGDINLGTNFGLIKQNADADILNTTTSYLAVNFQYYVSDNISLGFGPALNRSSTLNGAFIVNDNIWNFFADYSFLSANGKTLPYVGISYSFYNTKVKQGDLSGTGDDLGDLFGFPVGGGGGGASGVNVDVKYKRSVASLIMGIKFFVTERLNIDNKFSYGTVLSETIEFDVFGFGASIDGPADGKLLQFTVGFGYIIGKRGT